MATAIPASANDLPDCSMSSTINTVVAPTGRRASTELATTRNTPGWRKNGR